MAFAGKRRGYLERISNLFHTMQYLRSLPNSCTVGSLRVGGLTEMVKESIQSRVVKEQLATAGDGI